MTPLLALVFITTIFLLAFAAIQMWWTRQHRINLERHRERIDQIYAEHSRQ